MALSDHLNRSAPAESGVLDLDGTEQAGLTSTAPGRSVRGFRACSAGDPYAETESHSERGNPDPRRGDFTALPTPGQEPIPIHYDNSLSLVVVDPRQAPERPRQGFTGADPARPATFRRPLMLRLFDKLMSDHGAGGDKVALGSPHAFIDRQSLGDLAGGQPSAAGSAGTQREGIGPQPNTFRVLPDQWDALLVNTGGPAVSASNPDPAYTAAASTTASRWRAR